MNTDALKIPSISELSQDDLDALLTMEHRAYAVPWTRGNLNESLQNGHIGMACRLEGQLVGYAFLMCVLDEMHLLNLTIDPNFQGRGWGRLLLEAVKDRSRTLGCAQLLLEVRHGNTRALALYRKAGFKPIGVRQQYYPSFHGREDAIVMRSFL